MEFRVASILASFSSSGTGTVGRPSVPLSRSRLPMWLRVAPHPASSGSAGDGSSSCLEFHILQRYWLLNLRVAPIFRSSSCAFPMSPPGRPGFFIFRPCRRWIFGLPRISHPSALRGASAWGCPRSLALPVAPADESPGCPGFSIFRLCRRRIFELPRISRPSAPLALMLRVAPRLRTSSCASRFGCGFPRTPRLPALPRV
jgi:hypothetical protein